MCNTWFILFEHHTYFFGKKNLISFFYQLRPFFVRISLSSRNLLSQFTQICKKPLQILNLRQPLLTSSIPVTLSQETCQTFIINLFILQDIPYQFVKDQVGIQNTPNSIDQGGPNGPNVSELPGPVVFPCLLPKSSRKCIETPQKLCAYTARSQALSGPYLLYGYQLKMTFLLNFNFDPLNGFQNTNKHSETLGHIEMHPTGSREHHIWAFGTDLSQLMAKIKYFDFSDHFQGWIWPFPEL